MYYFLKVAEERKSGRRNFSNCDKDFFSRCNLNDKESYAETGKNKSSKIFFMGVFFGRNTATVIFGVQIKKINTLKAVTLRMPLKLGKTG